MTWAAGKGGAGGGGGGVTDHGALTGLSDDDHPHYLLADGTRALTGALDVGGNAITNAASVSVTLAGQTPTQPGQLTSKAYVDSTHARERFYVGQDTQQTVISTTVGFTTLVLDRSADWVIDSGFSWSEDTGSPPATYELTCLNAGTVWVQWGMNVKYVAGNVRGDWLGYIDHMPSGGSWAEAWGTRIGDYLRSTVRGSSGVCTLRPIAVGANDKLRCRWETLSGGAASISGITIAKTVSMYAEYR